MYFNGDLKRPPGRSGSTGSWVGNVKVPRCQSQLRDAETMIEWNTTGVLAL